MSRLIHPVRYTLTPIARAMLVVFLGGAVGATLMPSSLLAAEVDAVISFDIPAGSLDQALSRFGRQAGIQIAVNAELTNNRNSPGVSGNMASLMACINCFPVVVWRRYVMQVVNIRCVR